MDETKVLSLITEGESTKLDFKKELDLSSARGKAEFVKDLISLANSAEDSGCLIVGVDDNKQIIGIDELNEEQVQQIAYTYITPPVVIRCALVPIANAGLLCVGIIEAKAQSKPHKVARAIDRLNQDDVFIRRGSVVMRASPEEIIAMHSVTTQPPREAQQYAQAAEAHIKLGNLDTAINLYTQAIERFPMPDFLLARGEAYQYIIVESDLTREQREEFGDRALKDFTDALNLATTIDQEKRARFGRAQVCSSHWCRYQNNNWEAWKQDIDWLKAHVEGRELGKVLYLEVLMGDKNVGIDKNEYWLNTLNQAVDAGYDEPEVYSLRAVAHYQTYNYGLALKDASKAIEELKQKDALEEALCMKAEILVQMERFDEAFEAYSVARRLTNKEFVDGRFGLIGTYSSLDEVNILCRCGLSREFLCLDERELQTIGYFAQSLRAWYQEVRQRYPRIAKAIQEINSE